MVEHSNKLLASEEKATTTTIRSAEEGTDIERHFGWTLLDKPVLFASPRKVSVVGKRNDQISNTRGAVCSQNWCRHIC